MYYSVGIRGRVDLRDSFWADRGAITFVYTVSLSDFVSLMKDLLGPLFVSPYPFRCTFFSFSLPLRLCMLFYVECFYVTHTQ